MSMNFKKLNDIIKGFGNYWFDNDSVKESANIKANVCASCPLNVNNYCSKRVNGKAVKDFQYNEELRFEGKEYPGCGCFLPAKLKSDSQCPLGNW